jgi:hypothetical protein
MMLNLFLVAVLWLSQAAPSGSDVLRFAKPSEAFAFANAPMVEWEAAVKARRPPKTRIAPKAEVWRRAKVLCPTFGVENVSGEELYWLAKLCEVQPSIGMSAVQRYLEGSQREHRPDAHLLLSQMQAQTTGSWVSSWETLRTILQEDPIESEQEVRLRAAIDDEADEDEATALQWAEQRYAILRERLQNPSPGVPPISSAWVILAGPAESQRFPEEIHKRQSPSCRCHHI